MPHLGSSQRDRSRVLVYELIADGPVEVRRDFDDQSQNCLRVSAAHPVVRTWDVEENR